MSAILKICQNMYTNDVSPPMLEVLRLRTQNNVCLLPFVAGVNYC